MPVKDVKIYTGAAEGWVSIGDLSKASLPIASSEGNCRIEVSDGNADPADNRMYFVNTVESSVNGVPPSGHEGLVVCPTYTGDVWSGGSLLSGRSLSHAEFKGNFELSGQLGSKSWSDTLDIWCNRITGYEGSRDGVAWINFMSADDPNEFGYRDGWDSQPPNANQDIRYDQRIQFCLGSSGDPIFAGLEVLGKNGDLRTKPPFVVINDYAEAREADGTYTSAAASWWESSPDTQVATKGYVNSYTAGLKLCEIEDVRFYCNETSARIPQDSVLFRKLTDANPDGINYDEDDYWNFGYVGNLYLGHPGSYPPGEEPDPDNPDEDYFYRDWDLGTVGWEIQTLRNMINELGAPSVPELPPGEEAGEQYDLLKFSEQGSTHPQWNNDFSAIDGVFTNGAEWSTDGLSFFRTTQSKGISVSAYNLLRCTESGTLYMDNYGSYFSYDLKGWFEVTGTITNLSRNYDLKSNVFLFNKKIYTWVQYYNAGSYRRAYLLRYNAFSQAWENVYRNGLETSASEKSLIDSIGNLFTDDGDTDNVDSSIIACSSYNDADVQDTLVHLVSPLGAAWYFKENGVAVELTESQCPRAGLQYFIREKCNGVVYVYAVYENGMSVSTDGINFGPINVYPQASDYARPVCDGVRWHTCGPAGQPVILYGEQSGQTITWTKISQATPGDTVAATNGRVMISAPFQVDEYLLSGSVNGVYTNRVLLTTNSGEIRSLQSPRLTIDHAETQEDANNIFVDRFVNSGNLQIGSPDNADWDAGTIGEALQNGGGGGVDFTPEVGVDTTDCSIGPADSTGSFTKDGAEVDGVQKYKLDLTLPRPPVVTTSEDEPTGGCDGDFWIDTSG